MMMMLRTFMKRVDETSSLYRIDRRITTCQAIRCNYIVHDRHKSPLRTFPLLLFEAPRVLVHR